MAIHGRKNCQLREKANSFVQKKEEEERNSNIYMQL